MYEAMGFDCEPLGGGRIVRDDTQKTIHIYGYSVGFGGAEGGGRYTHAPCAPVTTRDDPGGLLMTFDDR